MVKTALATENQVHNLPYPRLLLHQHRFFSSVRRFKNRYEEETTMLAKKEKKKEGVKEGRKKKEGEGRRERQACSAQKRAI